MNEVNETSFKLIYVIVNQGVGCRVLRNAKKHGASGGTIFLGKGTVSSAILNFFSVYDEKKEIVLIGIESGAAEHILKELSAKFQFEKHNHGIAFTIKSVIIGSQINSADTLEIKKGEEKPMYKLITTIVNAGKADEVIEASKTAGAKGGTIINARGSAQDETCKIFGMEIEPEKEIVLIVAEQDSAEAIALSIKERLDIDKPGNGIIIMQDIAETYGLSE